MIRLIAAILLVAALAVPVLALEPGQVLVIASGSDAESVEIAQYYCSRRSVPAENLIKLPLPQDRADSISRADYRAFVEVPVRRILSSEEFAGKIKCLLTVYGVPFKIGGRGVDPAESGYLDQLDKLTRKKTALLRELIEDVQRLGVQGKQAAEDTDYTGKSAVTMLRGLSGVFAKAKSRVDKIGDDSERRRKYRQLLALYEQAYGKPKAIEYARGVDGISIEATGRERMELLDRIRRLNRLQSGKWNLKERIEGNFFDLVESVGGLVAVVDNLISATDRIKGVETGASLDSELAMVMFDDYDLYRWQPNELRQRVLWVGTKTLMVSRLDGPGKDIVKGLVDKAIAAEKTGLEGKAYFDSRFGDNKSKSQYAEYDISIQKAADLVRDKTSFEVIEERSGKLFATGDCPETALYCGWYSLRKYVDAFDFVDGAVGYHIASFEAVSLRDAQSSQWCAAMLRDGITATLGPVAEPYLHAFPKPGEFFAELINGKCLVEAYYRTKPMNSWQMLLIGDPLYRPFRK